MSSEEILQLIQQRESFRLEAKKAEKRVRLEILLDESLISPVTDPVIDPVTDSVTDPITNRSANYNLSKRQEAVLSYCREAHSSREICI